MNIWPIIFHAHFYRKVYCSLSERLWDPCTHCGFRFQSKSQSQRGTSNCSCYFLGVCVCVCAKASQSLRNDPSVHLVEGCLGVSFNLEHQPKISQCRTMQCILKTILQTNPNRINMDYIMLSETISFSICRLFDRSVCCMHCMPVSRWVDLSIFLCPTVPTVPTDAWLALTSQCTFSFKCFNVNDKFEKSILSQLRLVGDTSVPRPEMLVS